MRRGMVQLPASKRKLAALGERLAKDELRRGDQDLYLAVLDTYDRVQQATRGVIEELAIPADLYGGFDVTGRTKTLDTLVQKLRRSPETKLPYIRDIAGVRIVGDFNTATQRALADRLRTLFDTEQIPLVDRLEVPASGYRAIHAVLRIDDVPVEVQVRTRLQHLWAETFERMADRWGRQIRYGEPPDPGEVPYADRIPVTRADVVAAMQRLSTELIAAVEESDMLVFTLERVLRTEDPVGDSIRGSLSLRFPDEAERAALLQQVADARAADDAGKQQIGAMLTLLSRWISEDDPSHDVDA
jgi:hypothetical protein